MSLFELAPSVCALVTATSGELATINIVPHQSLVIYKNYIYALSLERGHFESIQGRIIFKAYHLTILKLFLFLLFIIM